MTPYVGAIFAFGFNFAPSGWALCNGQTLPIANYEALFALIGTTYGGNGTTTFGIPNLAGRTPIGYGQGPGLHNYALGQTAGSETVTLTVANLPVHTHPVASATVPATNAVAATSAPANTNMYATSSFANGYNAAAAGGPMAATIAASGTTGNGVPISILNQFQTVSYCIALFGIFPQRN